MLLFTLNLEGDAIAAGPSVQNVVSVTAYMTPTSMHELSVTVGTGTILEMSQTITRELSI